MFCVKPGRGCRAPPTDPHSHFSPRGWALRNRRLTCQGHPDGSVGKKLHDLRKDSLSGRQNAPGCQDANVSCCGNAQDGNAARNQCTPRARRGACRVDRRCEHGRDDVRTSSSKSADMVERMSGLGRAKVRTRVCAGAHASEQTCGLGRDARRGGTRALGGLKCIVTQKSPPGRRAPPGEGMRCLLFALFLERGFGQTEEFRGLGHIRFCGNHTIDHRAFDLGENRFFARA